MQLPAQTAGLGGGMTEAVVTNGAQPSGQDMPQIARDKLHARQGAGLHAMAGVTVLPAESDGLLGHFEDARIADRGPGHVGTQILERSSAVAGLLMEAARAGS